jgi:hypothetical protein
MMAEPHDPLDPLKPLLRLTYFLLALCIILG